MSAQSYDAIIIGAGPAGCNAAIRAARQGLRIAVIEKAEHPRLKVCGGGVVKRAYEHFPIDISPAVDAEIYSTSLHWHQSQFSLCAQSEQPHIYMVMRPKLDHLMLKAAQNAGVAIFQKENLRAIEQDENQVTVTSDQFCWQAPWLIIADGASGQSAKLCGWTNTGQHTVPALEAELCVDPQTFARLAHCRFDFNIVDRGYGWVFPKKNHLSIGLGCFRPEPGGPALNLKGTLEHYLNVLGIHAKNILDRQQKGFVIPLKPRAEGLTRGRIMLTGDAAGLADPLTAEGISAALISGQVAAEALNQANACQHYRQQLEKKLLIDLQASEKIAERFYQWPELARQYLRLRGDKALSRAIQVFSGELKFTDFYQQASGWKKFLLKQLAT